MMADMKELLVELLTDCEAKGFWYCGKDCKTGEHGGHEMTAEDIADYLAENIASEWISVKDRLPKPFTPVLVYRKSFGTLPPYIKVDKMTLWNDDAQIWTDEVGNWKNVTTHWMPLPQPPKGE